MALQYKLNLWLKITRLFTRNLPPVRGARYLAKKISKFYRRRLKDEFIINVLNFRMQLTPAERVADAWCLFHPQLYDDREMRFLRKNLKSGNVFVDVGAHVGFYSLVASRIVGGKGRVISIEAAPDTFRRLEENLALNGVDNVTAYQRGVSDKSETLRLYIPRKDSSSSSFLDSLALNAKETIEVDCLSLLAILQEAGIQNVDCLKLDIEGFEYKVLKAFFRDAPLQLHPRCIIVEQVPSLRSGVGEDVLKLIKDTGKYKLVFNKTSNYIFQYDQT